MHCKCMVTAGGEHSSATTVLNVLIAPAIAETVMVVKAGRRVAVA